MQVDQGRLAADFISLCEIDSPSRREGPMVERLREIFNELHCDELVEDDSAAVTGSERGNLLVRFNGSAERTPLFFCCHMDTVEPGTGVRVHYENGVFSSAGDTVLGSDDKSGIVALIEAMRVIREQGLDFCPVEMLFTTCEEIGLLGAKAFDPGNLRAPMGYALDSTGVGRVIIGAPASNHLRVTVRGVAAHAGLHPEWGVSAISLAAAALAEIPAGRIDAESSVNFGTIQGGVARNIVADEVVINGEIRSHSPQTLEQLTNHARDVFYETVYGWNDPGGQVKGAPELFFEVLPDFPLMRLSADDPVIARVNRAAQAIGMHLEYGTAGGGSDANILNGHGLATAIIATGMSHVHSTDEYVKLQDMVDLTELIIALLTRPS